MPLNQQQLRDDLREHLGVDDVEYDNTKTDLLLNRSWWEVAAKFKFREADIKVTWNTVVGQSSYTYTQVGASTLEAVKIISIEDLNSKLHDPLEFIQSGEFELKFVNRTDTRGKPEFYTRLGTSVILQPVPDAIYAMTSYLKSTLADIATGGLTVPQSWHEIVLFGAVWRGFARLGDWNRSQLAKASQFGLINSETPTEAKEKENLPMAGLRVLRQSYP